MIIDRIGGRDAGHIVVQHGIVHGKAGHLHALHAHAQLEACIGHHPVDIGSLELDHGAVSAQCAALAGLAPALLANFEEDGAGEAFRGHGVYLQMQTLNGFKAVALLTVGRPLLANHVLTAAGLAHEVAAIDIVKGKLERSLDLEVNGTGRGRCSTEKTENKKENGNFFHGSGHKSQVFPVTY